MAEIDNDTDTEADAEDAPPAAGGLVKKIIIGVAAVLLLGAGIFAGPAIRNLLNPPAGTDAAATGTDAKAEVVEPPDTSEPELYVGLHPALVVNFQDATGDNHFMQIEMEVMAREQSVIDAVKEHMAVIRNSLILSYGSVDYDAIRTRAGKEKMLADGLEDIQEILKKRIGKPGVEALYFTSLIIQ